MRLKSPGLSRCRPFGVSPPVHPLLGGATPENGSQGACRGTAGTKARATAAAFHAGPVLGSSPRGRVPSPHTELYCLRTLLGKTQDVIGG